MRTCLTLILITFLTACATTGGGLPRHSKVVPVSLLGDTLDLRVVGVTVFGNSTTPIDVSDWHVDQQIERTAINLLGAGGLDSAIASPDLKKHIGTISFFNLIGSYSFSGGKDGIKRVASATGADYLLVVAKAPNAISDPFFRTNQFITGYGIYQRRVLFGKGSAVDFVQIVVLLVDGKTGEVIDSRIDWRSSPRPESLWLGDDQTTLDPANTAHAKNNIMPLVDATFRSAFGKLMPTASQ